MKSINKLVITNDSPRPDNISNTYQILMTAKKIRRNFKLSTNLRRNCPKCSVDFNIKDNFQEIVETMKDTDTVMLGSPAYLDMPTSQMGAFLTRLNCKTENTNHKFFKIIKHT